MFFNQYPYLNLNDLNLDYILKAIADMKIEVRDFVSINAIKYADPIQWGITRQYEKNTIVIDPVTGTAYISVAPVPAGVALTRPEFWTVVFDLGSFVTRAAQNFTRRWESETTTTATFPTNQNEWLVWGDVLYKALVNITAGDTYVVGSNIDHFTMEDLYNSYLNTINNILTMIGDLADLTTSDTSNIVNAINSVVSNVGNLANLTTRNKTSIVSAINELKGDLPWYNIRDYGMEDGDNIYDDLYDLLHDVVNPNGGGIVYFPAGNYTVDYTIFIPSNTVFIGEGNNTVITFDLTDTYFGCAFQQAGSNVVIKDMCVEIASNVPYNTRGALPNTIGIGDVDYNGITGKRVHEEPRIAGNKNIYVENVNSLSSNYGIQIEPLTYSVENIFISNHSCPTGMFSIYDNVDVKNVYIDNLICDSLRLGQTNHNTDNIAFNNLYCTQMLLHIDNLSINNFTLFSSKGNRITGAFHENAAIYTNGNNIKLSNGCIIRDASSPQTKLLDKATDVTDYRFYIENVNVDNPAAFTGSLADPAHFSIFYSNFNFNPYKGYSTITPGNFTSKVPTNCVFNCTRGLSRITGLFSITPTDVEDELLGTINSNLLNTEIPQNVNAIAILYNYLDRTIAPEIATVKLQSDGTIHIIRPVRSGNTYDCVAFDLVW